VIQILDALVALKWVLAEPDSDVALRLRLEFEQGLRELIAPDIFPAECGHALTGAERKRVLTQGDAVIHLANIATTLPKLHATTPIMVRAAIIASDTRTSFYDCLYVALAEKEHCDLITADAKLAQKLKGYPIIDLKDI